MLSMNGDEDEEMRPRAPSLIFQEDSSNIKIMKKNNEFSFWMDTRWNDCRPDERMIGEQKMKDGQKHTVAL